MIMKSKLMFNYNIYIAHKLSTIYSSVLLKLMIAHDEHYPWVVMAFNTMHIFNINTAFLKHA